MLADHGLVGKCVSLQWVPVESIGTKALLDLAERQAEGEAGSMQGALCGTQSQDWDHTLSQRLKLNC